MKVVRFSYHDEVRYEFMNGDSYKYSDAQVSKKIRCEIYFLLIKVYFALY